MTEKPEISRGDDPIPYNRKQAEPAVEKEQGTFKTKMYNSTQECDSTLDPNDVAEDFLRQSIDEVWSDIAWKRKSGEHAAQRADAALVQYLIAHVAAHSDPQSFLRSLRTAVLSLGSQAEELE